LFAFTGDRRTGDGTRYCDQDDDYGKRCERSTFHCFLLGIFQRFEISVGEAREM